MTCFFRACTPASTPISNCVKHLVDCTGSQPTYGTRTRLEWHTSHGTHTHTIPTKRYPNGAPLLLTATGSLRQPPFTTAQLISKHQLLTMICRRLLMARVACCIEPAPRGQKRQASTTGNCPACSCSPRSAARVNSTAQPPAATPPRSRPAADRPRVLRHTLATVAAACTVSCKQHERRRRS